MPDKMNKNIKLKEKEHIKYLDKRKDYCLNQSWSKWKLLKITMKQRNFIRIQ
jgi:hypothetical protein